MIDVSDLHLPWFLEKRIVPERERSHGDRDQAIVIVDRIGTGRARLCRQVCSRHRAGLSTSRAGSARCNPENRYADRTGDEADAPDCGRYAAGYDTGSKEQDTNTFQDKAGKEENHKKMLLPGGEKSLHNREGTGSPAGTGPGESARVTMRERERELWPQQI